MDAEVVWDVSDAPGFATKAAGRRDDVLWYDGGDTAVLKITHRGDGNFAVWAYGDDTDLLVNEIGSYTGEQIVQPYTVLAISAEGRWTMAAQ